MKSLKVMMTLLIVATITIFTSCSGNNDNPKREPSIVDLSKTSNFAPQSNSQPNSEMYMQICGICGGSGRFIQNYGGIGVDAGPCPTCGGSGVVPDVYRTILNQ